MQWFIDLDATKHRTSDPWVCCCQHVGTLVPPFIGVRVNEIVTLSIDKDGDGMISPGDVVEYTVRILKEANDFIQCT